MRVALVNTNRIQPPIGPIGMEYVTEAVNAAGHRVEILDLCWVEDWETAIANFFTASEFELVGLSLRNTDDCTCASRQSFLGGFAAMVAAVRQHTGALIALGGVGFSVMPEPVLELCGGDVGVWGDGEGAFAGLADRIDTGQEWRDLPGLVWRDKGTWQRNPPAYLPLDALPPMTRTWLDNPRYFREGGQAGVETKRGCPRSCTYCADPLAKGNHTRVRPPAAVVDEMEKLLAQGIDHFHTCDSEFNVPSAHAAAVCEEIVRRNLGDRLRWYAYCSPVPFSPELAGLMRRAGCAGINFGVDSGDAGMLRRLRRDFTPDDIVDTTRWCGEAGMVVMLDLLLGAPGETRESIAGTIALMHQAAPERVGVALGVRVYPGTELERQVRQEDLKEGLIGGDELSEPLFFIEPGVAPFAVELLEELLGDDRRFFFDPSGPDRNYNYNNNQRLVDAIRAGYRGAYWDILRRYEDPACTT